MDEHGAQPDGGAVHEHELARRPHAAHAAQLAEHVLRHLAAVAFDHALGETARPVVHQRAIEEGGPAVQHGDHLMRQAGKAPILVGRHGARDVVGHQRAVKLDRAAHETRREDPDAAEIHQIDRTVRPHRVVAEMRIAVDHAVGIERHVPGAEHVGGQPVLVLLRMALPVEQWLALQPGHGEQPVGRVRGHDLRHVHAGLVAQHVAIERHVPGLAPVVQLLAQARGDLGMDLVGTDGGIEALADREDEL